LTSGCGAEAWSNDLIDGMTLTTPASALAAPAPANSVRRDNLLGTEGILKSPGIFAYERKSISLLLSQSNRISRSRQSGKPENSSLKKGFGAISCVFSNTQ
jgi:hypothetical protein